MHLKRVKLYPDTYPTRDRYPFNLPIFFHEQSVSFSTPITLFVGENGTGKSTLLEALARLCDIYIWRDNDRRRYQYNPHEEKFHQNCSIEWTAGSVPGAFFGSNIFHHFAQLLDEWAANDPGQLDYFGGKSLVAQSHGQSLMSFFKSRCQQKGLYLLDEPETALSPRSQIELLDLLVAAGGTSQAQFIIATHSPILLACPGAVLYSFDGDRITKTAYEETAHYKLYKSFLNNRSTYVLGDKQPR